MNNTEHLNKENPYIATLLQKQEGEYFHVKNTAKEFIKKALTPSKYRGEELGLLAAP